MYVFGYRDITIYTYTYTYRHRYYIDRYTLVYPNIVIDHFVTKTLTIP